MKLKYTLSLFLLAACNLFRPRLRRESCHNIASNVGTHATGALPLECQSAAISQRYLLVQKGTNDNQFVVNVATTRPWGVVADEPNIGDLATVLLLGCMPGTMKMVANAAIPAGTAIYTAAAGKVTGGFSATAYMVGRAITSAAADGDLIEVAHCFPLLNAAAL